MAVYVKAYSQAGALRGAFSDYRAGRDDVAQDEADKQVLIRCPTLVLWGEDVSIGGKMWNFREIWKQMAQDLRFVSIPQCDHLPHEEQPDQVNEARLKFLEPYGSPCSGARLIR